MLNRYSLEIFSLAHTMLGNVAMKMCARVEGLIDSRNQHTGNIYSTNKTVTQASVD